MILISLILLLLTALVNFIGVLGPELSFDALWYHLTLPKIYLMEKAIKFIPGGLLYYSVMPRLGEMFYTLALLIGDERSAKFIHFSFGLLAAFFTYKISCFYLNKKFSLLAVLVFYSTLIVGWLSTSAYIDLIRTAFEAGAFFFFIRWWKEDWENKGDKRSAKNLYLTGLFLGIAISVKLLALGSVIIFILLIFFTSFAPSNISCHCEPNSALQKRRGNLGLLRIYRDCFVSRLSRNPRNDKNAKFVFLMTFFFVICVLIPVLPWFYLAFRATGNPFYPLGAGILDPSHRIPVFSLTKFFSEFWNLILKPQDLLSPIFLIILPIGVIWGIREIWEKKREDKLFVLFFYCLSTYVVWYFTPRTGGGRFILPYLPAWSVLSAYLITRQEQRLKSFLTVIVFIIAFTHLGYRFMANKKYWSYILGKQTKRDFLCQNLDFKTNVFYDCDNYFQRMIKITDKVLIYGTHNLYYVNFPFIHESWRKKEDRFNYVLTQNCSLPLEFAKLPLVYKNIKTGVKLYKMIKR